MHVGFPRYRQRSLLKRTAICITTLALTLAGSIASAQTRFVVVNGQRMTDDQIMLLQYFACTFIPNGAYWINLSNGAWGYYGNWQVQGYFGDQCNLPANYQARERKKSLSERGLLFGPGEIISGKTGGVY